MTQTNKNEEPKKGFSQRKKKKHMERERISMIKSRQLVSCHRYTQQKTFGSQEEVEFPLLVLVEPEAAVVAVAAPLLHC